MRLNARFGLAFATTSLVSEINLAAWNNSPDHYAKGTAVRHCGNLRHRHSPPTACKLVGFRFYFTLLTGVLFNFPSRYLFTIGRLRVFSLGSWFSEIPAWFHLSSSTWARSKEGNVIFAYWTITILGRFFQTLQLTTSTLLSRLEAETLLPATPPIQRPQSLTYRRFRLFPFRSPLLGESRLLSLPWVTKMFQFTQFAS